MRQRFPAFAISALVLLALAGFGWGFAEKQKLAAQDFDQRRLVLLDAENERLRDAVTAQQKASEQAENVAIRAQIEKTTATLRHLEFLKPVTYAVLTRAGIRNVLEEKLSQQYSNEEFKNAGIGLAALGLLPPDYPLKEKFIELLGEQVAAFYDQHQHKLFMFEDATLANAQNRIVLAHELTHALQDQHFGLLKLPLEIKTDDDRAFAASALIEGDATLLMSQYMMANISLSGLRDNLHGALSQNMRKLQEAPRYLREMLVFPYLRGQEFCNALYARGGWDAVSACYKNPPSSTSQILHIDQYLAEPHVEPISVQWPAISANGEKPLADNVLGEMGTRILLSEWIDPQKAESAADGWRGDRYLVFDHGDALVWKTVWADAQKAREFKEALASARHARDVANGAKTITWDIVSHAENEVVLIEAKDEKWKQLLKQKF